MTTGRHSTGSAANPRGRRWGPIGGERARSRSGSGPRMTLGGETIFRTLGANEYVNKSELYVVSSAATLGVFEESVCAIEDGYLQTLSDAIDFGCLLEALDAYRDGYLETYMNTERNLI